MTTPNARVECKQTLEKQIAKVLKRACRVFSCDLWKEGKMFYVFTVPLWHYLVVARW